MMTSSEFLNSMIANNGSESGLFTDIPHTLDASQVSNAD